jgi:hypothetical protein
MKFRGLAELAKLAAAKHDIELLRVRDFETLASARATPARVRAATNAIETAIYDQGCAGPVTTKTVPYLVEVLAGAPTALAKQRVVSLLADMLTDDEDLVFERGAVSGALAAAVRRGRKAYERLLVDRDAGVRAQAARVLAYHRGTGALLAARAASETDRKVRATLVVAAAMQGRAPAVVDDACSALAALVAGRKLDDAIAAQLIRALDDRRLDGTCALFHGNLRAAATDALGRFGRGNTQAIDALVAHRASEELVGDEGPDKIALGKLAIIALVQIAVPRAGKLDAAGKQIILRIVDVKPGWALARRGLPGDPRALARLLGIAPMERPSALGPLRAAIVALATGERRYDPRTLVAKLAELQRDARADVVFDLLAGRDGIDAQWSYGKHVVKRARPGQERAVIERRLARVRDLCIRVLLDAGPAIASRLDDEIATLREAFEAAKANRSRDVDYRGMLAALALARALLHARASEPIPDPVRELLRPALDWKFATPYVAEILDAKLIARFPERQWLWRHVDNPLALRELTAWAKHPDTNKTWVPPLYDIGTGAIERIDARALAPLMREAAKCPVGDVVLRFTAPGGEVLSIKTTRTHGYVTGESELDQVYCG